MALARGRICQREASAREEEEKKRFWRQIVEPTFWSSFFHEALVQSARLSRIFSSSIKRGCKVCIHVVGLGR